MVPFVTHLKQFLVQSLCARVKVVVIAVVAVSPGTSAPQILRGEIVPKEAQALLGSLSLISGVRDKWERRRYPGQCFHLRPGKSFPLHQTWEEQRFQLIC